MPCCYPPADTVSSSSLNEIESAPVQQETTHNAAGLPEVNTTLVDVSAAVDTAPNNEADLTVADDYYHILRDAIGRHIESATLRGKLIVTEKPQWSALPGDDKLSYGPINFDDFRLSLPAGAHQHYNCTCCRNAWSQMAGLAVIDSDGVITYPMVDAFQEVADSGQAPLAVKLLEALGQRKKQRATLQPLSNLSHVLLETDHGGWTHFYGVRDADLLQSFNNSLVPMHDFEYVETLFKRLVDATATDPVLLAKIFTYIVSHLGAKNIQHTALSRRDALVQLIHDVRRVHEKSQRGLIWLWATMQKSENRWMRHIVGSVLGVVLDAEREVRADPAKMEKALMECKRLLASATAPENHKQKTAEAPEASVEQAYRFLTDNGLQNTLRRRLFPISEVTSIVWTENGALQAQDIPEDAEALDLDPLAAAFGELKQEKNPTARVSRSMDDILAGVNVSAQMSVQAFVELLPEIVSLKVSPLTPVALPMMVTGAVGEGAHEKLLSFDVEVGPYTSVLTTPQAMQFGVISAIGLNTPHDPRPRELPVSAVFRSRRFQGDDANYVLHIDGFAQTFAQGMVPHGTAVLGSAIVSEHFGMSRALVELSRKMQLDTTAGMQAAGGVMLRTNMVFDAKLKDGTSRTITITSVK